MAVLGSFQDVATHTFCICRDCGEGRKCIDAKQTTEADYDMT